MAAIERIALHTQKCRDRANGHLNAIGSAARHVTRDCNELIKAQSEIRGIARCTTKSLTIGGLFFTISASRGDRKSTTILVGPTSSVGTSRMSRKRFTSGLVRSRCQSTHTHHRQELRHRVRDRRRECQHAALSRFEPETRGLRTFENVISTVFAGEQIDATVRPSGIHLEKADRLLYMMRDD
ncbi:hypothetical protein [Rhizobium laguerreae]|uniref:hypothetical protein n=1 Tax=Rhizobium laguerreae TaxID=1076926 RepID=UPI001FEA20A1|nr:hypothetical protein [Rhizobium laguerreae]